MKGRAEADSESERERVWKWWPQARDRVQKGGGIILCMTRWHHDDLAGRLLRLAKENPDADQWEVINLEAIAPEHDPLGRAAGMPLAPHRYDVPDLLALKASIGDREWLAKFCGKPTDDEGAIFQRSWWRFEPLSAANPKATYLFADLAFSRREEADYTAMGVWGREDGPTFRLMDVVRRRLTFPDSRAEAERLWRRHRFRFAVIEKKGRTDDEFNAWRQGLPFPVFWYTPSKDKVLRAHSVTPAIASGQVILPSEPVAWLDDYLIELGQFDHGTSDDQVDMTTMALLILTGQERLRAAGPKLITFKMVA